MDIANRSFDVSRSTTSSSQNIVSEPTPQELSDTTIIPNTSSEFYDKPKDSGIKQNTSSEGSIDAASGNKRKKQTNKQQLTKGWENKKKQLSDRK